MIRLLIIVHFLFLTVMLLSVPAGINAQSNSKEQMLRVMFYNFENLFDPFDDTLTIDEEFLPGGSRNWTYSRMLRKLNNIYRVVAATGEWEAPAIIGCCEVENRFVLEKLIYQTPLKKFGYQIVHQESPDPRGIDVALIYRPDRFRPLESEWIPVCIPGGSSCSRDILHVKGTLLEGPIINVYVNHWPSRYGGPAETVDKRAYTARLLRSNVDTVFLSDEQANILIMGDFNDEPGDESLRLLTGQASNDSVFSSGSLINLMDHPYHKSLNEGTIKSAGVWGTFDQIIISSNLLLTKNDIRLATGRAEIMEADFLLVPDEKNLGFKPFRSFQGYYYTGGFSDHLPVYIDIVVSLNAGTEE